MRAIIKPSVLRLTFPVVLYCFFWGCGSKDVEFKAYSRNNGKLICPFCNRPVSNRSVSNTNTNFVDLSLPTVFRSHPITNVSSRKGVIKGVYLVKLESKCPKYPGEIFSVLEEYGCRNGKVRFIRMAHENE